MLLDKNILSMPFIRHEIIEKELANRKENMSYHLSPNDEKIALHYVETGQFEQIAQFLQQELTGKPGTLSTNNRIRSEKNNVIAWITLVCRAAISGGVNHEVALTMSDLYIIHLEELDTIESIRQLGYEATFHFTKQVLHKQTTDDSHAIQLCKAYIFKHLYEPITLEQLAAHTNLNHTYLCSLFQQEVGKSIMQYIQAKRIEEAKMLLQLTNHSLSTISSLLQFYDQSYFSKVFKKHTDQTPRQYRNHVTGGKA